MLFANSRAEANIFHIDSDGHRLLCADHGAAEHPETDLGSFTEHMKIGFDLVNVTCSLPAPASRLAFCSFGLNHQIWRCPSDSIGPNHVSHEYVAIGNITDVASCRLTLDLTAMPGCQDARTFLRVIAIRPA